MAFRSVFISIFIGTALIVAALVLNRARPDLASGGYGRERGAQFVRATGKCAECHSRETSAIVHMYEMSIHASKGVTCLDCHQPVDGQEPMAHSGFTLATEMTSLNCRQCHQAEYEEFLRSRHAAPAFAAVAGAKDFSEAQIAAAEKHHPGTVRRPANVLAIREGEGVLDLGCLACHNIGKPNSDGSIGSCTQCHSRHAASVALARQPEACGQCHMGPDHSQLEIFNESKHGILWAHYKSRMNLNAPANSLTTRDIPVPSCSTCHMSGLGDQHVTHDVTERLSWWLFAPVSKKRPTYDTGQTNMQEICLACHASSQVDKFYKDAEVVVHSTNQKVQAALDLVKALRDEGHLTPEPFDEPIEFLIFDLWHYYGRTAKHGAFMGGADFVQWHGNYELLLKKTELQAMATELRDKK